ncbi:hypothetical protein Tsubulata_030969 [Turnera subulata]|uniref:Uncharacterized protein n=1 Tax=Turnera subulata TaxID=218843 RepID=A0A9Q0J7G5_9ROSI|nr:hypothetical protein Tsubulata_030969 [Turnera subulata]
MGSLAGHVLPGLAFVIMGLWHLFNHIKLHSLGPNFYTSTPWFPTSKSRYLELYFIMVGTSISVSMELFIGPAKHHPFDVDGTIPSNHLRNVEHSLISMSFFVYAAFAIVLDKIKPKAQRANLTQLVGAIAFSQQLLLFYLHSTDHKGLEGQYHLFLQLLVAISLTTTLMGIGMPASFMVSFVRSFSILFQGLWFIVMGYMLWTPALIPKGCRLHSDDGHKIVSCASEEALHRAKSLVNIQFSWFFIGITVFVVSFYLALVGIYSPQVEYSPLGKEPKDIHEEFNDINTYESKRFSEGEKGFAPFSLERLSG